MLAEIEKAVPSRPRQTFSALLENVWAALTSDTLRPYIPLWLELAAVASRNTQPHRDVAAQIVDGYLEWVTSRLDTEHGEARIASASLFLVTIEGLYLLKGLGHQGVVDAAKSLLIELTKK